MGTGTLVRLKRPREMIGRGIGFALAVGIVGTALFAGSALRDPAGSLSAASAVGAAQDAKGQERVSGGVPPSSAPGILTTASPSADALPPSGAEPGEWREQEFAFVEIVDGRTLRAGGVTITLAGLALPQPDQVCRTLDDRLEPCVARAATQLELLTRSRRLACRYRMTTSSAATGSCRAGSRDLAERMVRTGYAQAGGTAVVATAGDAETQGR